MRASRSDAPGAATRHAPAPRFAQAVATGAWLVLATVAFIQVYLLLHEAGHALAAWSMGGSVRTIDARPWSSRPHAGYDLHGASEAAHAFIHAAGTLLTYLAWAFALLVLPRRLAAPYALMRLASTVGILASLIIWMVLPWRAFHPVTPGDDAVRFTLASGWPPALVVATAAALFLAGAAWAWWRVGGRAELVALVRTRSMAVPVRVAVGTGLAVVALVALAIGLHAAFPGAAAAPVDAALVLPEHAPLADRSFSGGPVDIVLAEGVAFDGVLHLVLGYDEVAGGPLELQVVDAAGVVHGVGSFGPDTTMGRATSRPGLTVAPGPWSLHLLAEELRGRVRVWEVVDPAR